MKTLLTLFFFIALNLQNIFGQTGYQLTPVSGADGVFDTIIVDGITVYRSVGTPGAYDLYMYFTCPVPVHNQTVFLEVKYLDAGIGYFDVQYNSMIENYQRTTINYRNYCLKTNSIVTAAFQLNNADFRKAQNMGTDLRLESYPSLQMNIISVTIFFKPTPIFQNLKPDWMGPYKGRTYEGDNLVDAATLNGKVVCGYQGWFRTPADPTGLGWQHFFGTFPDYVTVDLWPDVTEFTNDELCAVPDWELNSGKQAYLFSSANRRTVLRHFQWMETYGIDCAEIQRYWAKIGEIGDPASLRVLSYAREAAHKTGRTYYVSYGLESGYNPPKVVTTIEEDWKYLVDSMKISEDTRYLHNNGKPVIGIYGFHSPWITASFADSVLKIFEGNGPYSAFVKGAGEWFWRNDTTAGWPEVFRKMGAYSPWNIGNWGPGSLSDASTINWLPDKQALDSAGVIYMPLIYPGFSWDNMHNYSPGTTNHPRRKGEFMWKQFLAAKKIDATTVFVAMFDEIDEGTAIFKTSNDIPKNHYFLPLEQGLPSDYYLLLTGYGQKIINGNVIPSDIIPDFSRLSQPPIPDIKSPMNDDTLGKQVLINWTQVQHESGILGYELNLNGTFYNADSSSLKFDLEEREYIVKVRAINGLNNKSGWSIPIHFKVNHTAVDVETKKYSPPGKYELAQNYPNPFNLNTNIKFQILNTCFVSLKVYDILGNEVSVIVSKYLPSGSYKYEWNASELPSGVYFYRMITGNYADVKKMLLMK